MTKLITIRVQEHEEVFLKMLLEKLNIKIVENQTQDLEKQAFLEGLREAVADVKADIRGEKKLPELKDLIAELREEALVTI